MFHFHGEIEIKALLEAKIQRLESELKTERAQTEYFRNLYEKEKQKRSYKYC